MHRPKKKKNQDPLLPEDQQVDERHLVEAEDSAEISFEDRVNIYWMENKGFITGCIIVLALVIIGYQGMRLYKEQAIASLQESYRTAKAGESLENFARGNANRELGGIAAIEVADNAYEAEEFEKAAEFYEIAEKALAETLFAGRARLGHAFALFHGGNEAEGLSRLNTLAADATVPETIRAEAAYHLAIEAEVAGRTDEFESYAAQIENAEMASGWQRRLEDYRRQMR